MIAAVHGTPIDATGRIVRAAIIHIEDGTGVALHLQTEIARDGIGGGTRMTV
jgi:hypothetical protein